MAGPALALLVLSLFAGDFWACGDLKSLFRGPGLVIREGWVPVPLMGPPGSPAALDLQKVVRPPSAD